MASTLDTSIVEWTINAKLEHHLDYLEHRFKEIDVHYAGNLVHVEKKSSLQKHCDLMQKMKSATRKKLMAEHERSIVVLNELKAKVGAGRKVFHDEKN